MAKKIAVLVRERQSEALRMAIGLILMDDTIEIYALDRKVENNEQNELYLESLFDLGIKAYSNNRDNASMEYLPIEEIARRLPGYDHVLAY